MRFPFTFQNHMKHCAHKVTFEEDKLFQYYEAILLESKPK